MRTSRRTVKSQGSVTSHESGLERQSGVSLALYKGIVVHIITTKKLEINLNRSILIEMITVNNLLTVYDNI